PRLTAPEADGLIPAVPAAPLLSAHRGTPLMDTAALTDVLLRVSRLADDLHEVAELDLNPVVATQHGVHAVDARIRVAPAQPQDPFLRRLRCGHSGSWKWCRWRWPLLGRGGSRRRCRGAERERRLRGH